MDWDAVLEVGVFEKTLAGPVLEGDIDRALSVGLAIWSVGC